MLSINSAAEIPDLARDYADVTLIAAPTTAERIAGKPVPYIHDLLKALRQACVSHGAPLADCTVGIINADIHLRIPANRIGALTDAARYGLVLGPRVDVPTAEAMDRFTPTGKETYAVGYDYFLMSAAMLDDFNDSPFCIGMPFWDYWMPLMAMLKGRPLTAVLAPVALHVDHETQWDNSIYVFFHALIADVFEVCRKHKEQGTSAQARQFDLLYDILSHVYSDVFARGTQAGSENASNEAAITALATFYDRLQEVVVHHIKTNVCSLTFPMGSAS